jgi:recombination protein RecR
MMLPPSLEQLIQCFHRLPGIGKKTARRLAFHLLSTEGATTLLLADALREAHEKIRLCTNCFNFAEAILCPICSAPQRDSAIICVVEKPTDILNMEAGGFYNGTYHVLHGALSPLEGVGPEHLHIAELIQRAKTYAHEVILATGSSTEGEATALYIDRALKDTNIKRTRLARGIPAGSELEYLDEITLRRALEGRIHL